MALPHLLSCGSDTGRTYRLLETPRLIAAHGKLVEAVCSASGVTKQNTELDYLVNVIAAIEKVQT